MNYQYRYGTTTTQAIHILYEDGGWTRYYQGLTAALVQAPLRFAAYALMLRRTRRAYQNGVALSLWAAPAGRS